MRLNLSSNEDIRVLVAALRRVDFGLGEEVILTHSSWVPKFTASGAMTIVTTGIVFASYTRMGDMIFHKVRANITLGGVAGTTVFYTLPVDAFKEDQERFVSGSVDGNGASLAYTISDVNPDVSHGRLLHDNAGGNWTLGANGIVVVNGWYQVKKT